MTEDDFLQRWSKDIPLYESWGRFVCNTIEGLIGEACSPKALDEFIKIPACPRIKSTESLLAKAFRRGKEYSSPYNDITDKVGVRFVLFTTDDVRYICDLIENSCMWTHAKDRDFETEQLARPAFFAYQSMHYIVRPAQPLHHNGVLLNESIACEVQIRTLLQHAWSELSHDIVYKPNTMAASPHVERLCSRAAALVETVDEIFSRVSKSVSEASKPLETTMSILYDIYTRLVKSHPNDGTLNTFLLDAYRPLADDNINNDIISFYSDNSKEFIIGKIQERSKKQIMYRQPAILLVYYFASKKNIKRNNCGRSLQRNYILYILTLEFHSHIYNMHKKY